MHREFEENLFDLGDRFASLCLQRTESYLELHSVEVEGVQQLSGLAKKVTISEKSTIFVLSWWNLVKISYSWGSHFDKVSSG